MRKAAPGALIVVVALMLAGAGQANAQGTLWLNYGCMPSPSDCTGWYRAPVRLSWDWDDLTVDPSGGNCSTQQLTSDTRGLNIACEVTDGTDTLRRQVTIHIDRTAPTVSAAPARPPDYNGWFNHPVSVAFKGSDATSGVLSCTSASYGGPDAAGVVLNGSCQDVAGNVGGVSFPLNYDSTHPAAPDVTARPNDNRVTLRWAPPADAELIEIARVTETGLPALLFRGAGTSFTDRELKNGKRQRYLITSIDRAGNRAVDRASAVPTTSHLLSPADGAHLGQPPLLLWEGVKRATYYNVQVYRGTRKVLTRWPRTEQLQLAEVWRFAGLRRRLTPGRYRWFVFPGFGERSKRRFGKLLGQSSFRVVG